MSGGGRSVAVELSDRLGQWAPGVRQVWDDAYALGLALLGRHPLVESCTISVHARRRDSLRWRIDRDAYLELHWALTPHPEGVLDVLDGDKLAWKRLCTRLPARTPPTIRTRGVFHDLTELQAAEHRRAEEATGIDLPQVQVTWGRYGKKPSRGLRLGSCEPTDPPIIRIHPVLDHGTVPGWFVGFVLFHEILHVALPPEDGDTRRSVHSRAFREAERSHPDHASALAWERENLDALLARCRKR